MDLFNAAHELYGVNPGDFMDTRKRLVAAAKDAGDAGLAKEIGALRRPTLSAWAANQLSREAGDDLAQLLEVGAGLREAWAEGGSIAGLEQRRNELVDLLVRETKRLAAESGQPLRDPAVREVEETLQAAAVDPEVAEEVRIGQLTQPRSYAGFGLGGFSAPVQAPAPKKPAPKPKVSKAEQEEAERKRRAEAARVAEQKAEEAEQALADWKAEAEVAQGELNTITREADRLRAELDKVLARRSAAERRANLANREVNRAGRTAEEARRKAAEATRRR